MFLNRKLEFVILLLAAMGAGPAGAAIWNWSLTAANNGSADPSINFQEGQAPSSVNDSARALMAVVAAWRNDISGVNATAGTSTAYTLTTSEGVNTTPATGQMIAFIANVTNGASPTLTVDGGNTYPIWLNGVPVGAASMIAKTPYRVSFDAADGVWALEGGLANPYSTALGAFMISTAPAPPNSNFVLPAGQCISTTTYATYWVQQGSPASGTCAGGQFRIIDMRGRVPAALDNLNGTAANRLTASATGCGTAMTSVGAVCNNGVEQYALTTTQIPAVAFSGTTATENAAHTHQYFAPATTVGLQGGSTFSGNISQVVTNTSSESPTHAHTFSGNIAGGGGNHSTVQPTIGLNYFLRIL